MKSKKPSFTSCFMVWVDGAYGPAKRHEDLPSAKQEAERLCRKEGKSVYVMTDVLKCEPASAPVKWVRANVQSEPRSQRNNP